MLKEGTLAPDFELIDQDGKSVSLRDFRNKQNVVLYFYPMDNTPGCTKQACSFRDIFSDITASETVIVGVSRDSVSKHNSFVQQYSLPFSLLSDSDGGVSNAYKAKGLLGMSARVTYVIDKTGIVRCAYRNLLNPTKHIEAVLEALSQS